MGATLKGDTIYISNELLRVLTQRERRVLLAHEISHWKHKDSIKIFFINILFIIDPLVAYFLKRRIEMRADKEAILKTKDCDAFITLLDKLNRNRADYPDKFSSIQLANNMRGQI